MQRFLAAMAFMGKIVTYATDVLDWQSKLVDGAAGAGLKVALSPAQCEKMLKAGEPAFKLARKTLES